MTRRLPSTAALLAFESAARHQSFARAAQELSLTEGAISRQVARLEEFVGVRLFNRVGNRVELSTLGARYAEQMRDLLARMEQHTHQLLNDAQGSRSLELGVIPTMASRWLIPRLGRFQQRFADIRINLRARTQPFDLHESSLQAAISVEHPQWTGMQIQPLFQEPLVAVCHPSLAQNTPASIALLHKHGATDRWPAYAELSGMPLTVIDGGANYDRYSLLIDAARAGIGMALVPRLYVAEDLEAGRLSAPWPDVPELHERYVLVTRTDSQPCLALQTFQTWLLEEIQG